MDRTLLIELQSNQQKLSPVEKKIAAAILQDPRAFMSCSMAELAEQVQVSQGSIINFANKFSGGGFPRLKLQIAAELPAYEQQSANPASDSDGIHAVLEGTIRNTVQAFQHTSELNDADILNKVAAKILAAKKIEIYGVYRSGVVAEDFYLQLMQLGIPAAYVGDPFACAVSASMLSEDSLVIAVSASGETFDVIKAVKAAKANNVPIVCITAHRDSPLAKLADDLLISAPSGTSIRRNIEIRLSQLLLVDAICGYIRNTINEDCQNNYSLLQNILNLQNIKD